MESVEAHGLLFSQQPGLKQSSHRSKIDVSLECQELPRREWVVAEF